MQTPFRRLPSMRQSGARLTLPMFPVRVCSAAQALSRFRGTSRAEPVRGSMSIEEHRGDDNSSLADEYRVLPRCRGSRAVHGSRLPDSDLVIFDLTSSTNFSFCYPLLTSHPSFVLRLFHVYFPSQRCSEKSFYGLKVSTLTWTHVSRPARDGDFGLTSKPATRP